MVLEKMRSCLWQLEPGFWTNGLISPLPKALGPNCPKLVFRPQTQNVRTSGSVFFSCKLHKILHQISTYFTILGYFWKSYECLFPENCKKPFKNLYFGAISDIKFSLSIVSKKPVFWNTKIQISLEPLGILSNQVILIKFRFWPTSLSTA